METHVADYRAVPTAETVTELLAVASLPWMAARRWRVHALTSRRRRVVFVIYSMHEPTLEEVQSWFDVNHGEALEISNPSLQMAG